MLHRTLQFIAAGLLAGGLSAAGSPAMAADPYPSRAIEIVSGFGPGGASDLVARMAAKFLSEKWRVPINVINKPGGNTVPAQLEVYGSPPDGYRLYSDNIGSSSMLAISVPNLPFKVADRTFVAMISSNSMLLVVPPDSPLKTLKDVVEEAKRDPDGFTWTGVGVAEVPLRQLLKAAGVDIARTKPIVSTGTVSAAVLAAGGNVKLAIAGDGPMIGPIQSGLVRPIATAAEKRLAALPDVPTGAEAGFPTMKVVSWIGLSGPPNLPPEVLKKWNEGIAEMVKDPVIVDQLAKIASIVDFRDSDAFRKQVLNEVDEFQRLWSK